MKLHVNNLVGLPLLTVLHAINVFDALWLSYLYVALRRTLDCSRTSPVLVVAIYWVVTVGFSVALAVLSLDSNAAGI